MRFLLIAIVACLICALVGYAMGYISGRSASRKTRPFDPSKWKEGQTPSAVDEDGSQ